jgi:sugar-specific transcriptional regulator TrmB
MNLHEKLNAANLTANESKVYLELAKRGTSSANELAKALSLDRTLSYSLLNSLIEKGHVTQITIDKKKHFSIANPKSLLNSVKKNEAIIKDAIQEIKNIKIEPIAKYSVEVLEGKEGLRTLMKLFLEVPNTEYLSFGATGRVDLLYEAPLLVKEMKSKKITARVITTTKFRKAVFLKSPYIQLKYLKTESEVTTTISDNYVAIHVSKDKPFIILIKNKEIATSYKNHFEVLWKAAEEV